MMVDEARLSGIKARLQAAPESWHAGRTVGRTLYRGDGPNDLIGIMDSRELADFVAHAPEDIRWLIARDAAAREEAEEILTLSDAAKALEDRLKDERIVADSEGQDWPGRMLAAHSARQEAEHVFFEALARWRGRRGGG